MARTRLGELPADYVSLSQRCKELMKDTEWLHYEGLTPERLEGVYIERQRALSWISWLLADAQRGKFATGRAAMEFLQHKIEEGERV